MEATLCVTETRLHPAVFVLVDQDKPAPAASHAKSCWYCSLPVFDRRNFCSTACREALYDDNEYAKKRRLILGCQC